MIGIKDPETVAEHCFRTAVIGYVIAKIEKVCAESVMKMCLFNDIHEARINDAHKVAVRYLNFNAAEDKAFNEQTEYLPKAIKDDLRNMRRGYQSQKSKESIIARDADILECLLQAKEYYEQGYIQANLFFQKAPKFLKSKTAKKLWKDAQGWRSDQWWQKICEFKR